MNKGGDTWKDCEDRQGKLHIFANCSDRMFEKGSGDKWSFGKTKLDDCQKKINSNTVVNRAQKMLDFIKTCTDVEDARGWAGWTTNGAFINLLQSGGLKKSWENCEGTQNELTTIGCSGQMFEQVGGNIIEKKWSYKTSEANACQQIINQIKTSPDTKPGGGATDPTDPDAGGTTSDDIPCRGGPMGWVMCPLIEILSEALQTIAGFIDGMMQFRLLSQTNSQETLRNVWQTFLNIANVFLVIAFLAIIFSQTTSAGLSNYGIKRMLPRLVIGAILMNISFYACAFAIDISNIIGSSVMGLFTNMTDIANWDYTDSNGVVQQAFTDKSGADGLGTGFVKYLGAGIAAVVIILFFLIPVVLSALLVFVVLVARQVILTILVIVAPLAFVAWLLPNTEQYFKKWGGLFLQMLFAYPMVMAVFGAAIFVAELIQGVNQVNSHVGAAEIGGPGIISAIVPLVVLAIPLFLIPKLIMSTSAILGKIGNAANMVGKKLGGDALDNRMKEARGNSAFAQGRRARKEVRQHQRQRKLNEAISGEDTSLTGRMRRRAHRGTPVFTDAGEQARQQAEASAAAAVSEQQKKDLDAATIRLGQEASMNKSHPANAHGNSGELGYLQDQFHEALQNGDTLKAKAALASLKDKGERGANAIQQTISTNVASGVLNDASGAKTDMGEAVSGFISSSHDDLKEKDARITNWAGDNQNNPSAIDDINLRGLTDQQIATQTDEALTAAQGDQLFQNRKGGIGAAIDRGDIATKAGKRNYFN